VRLVRLIAPLAAAWALVACGRPAPGSRAAGTGSAAQAQLEFRRDGHALRSLTRAQLETGAAAEEFSVEDHYYRRAKRFRAVSLRRVLEIGFANRAENLVHEQFVLRAQDGYTVPIAGERLFEDGAYIAVADLDVPGWEPIGPQHTNPGPFYMIWRGAAQQDPETHPRPWQLASIEIAPFEAAFPHVVPPPAPRDGPVARGFATFRSFCIRCHAINREGGRVGPDLNVPQSIVEYRPVEQIRAYIRNPLAFRYGAMPPHPSLSDADLDGLVAYFTVMRDHKHDPDAHDAGASPPHDAP